MVLHLLMIQICGDRLSLASRTFTEGLIFRVWPQGSLYAGQPEAGMAAALGHSVISCDAGGKAEMGFVAKPIIYG